MEDIRIKYDQISLKKVTLVQLAMPLYVLKFLAYYPKLKTVISGEIFCGSISRRRPLPSTFIQFIVAVTPSFDV
jgi:hypothetical protein